MKSDRKAQINSFKPRRKWSSGPTMQSSSSQRRVWAKLFKDEPFPKDPIHRLIAHKLKLSDFQDEQEEGGVVVEQEEGQGVEQKPPLPHFTIMSDHGEFAQRGRSKSDVQNRPSEHRCRSVQSFRLPQVQEEKREDDEQRLARSKLSQVKDKNQFGQLSNRTQSNSLTDHDSQQNFIATVPQRIPEADAQETRSDHARQDKSLLAEQMQRLIVDEIDHKKSRDENQRQIEEIIEQEKQEDETDNVKKLRQSLSKLEQETEFLNKFKDEELRVSLNAQEQVDLAVPSQLQEIISENHQHHQY